MPGEIRTPDHLGNCSMRCSTSYIHVVVVRSHTEQFNLSTETVTCEAGFHGFYAARGSFTRNSMEYSTGTTPSVSTVPKASPVAMISAKE